MIFLKIHPSIEQAAESFSYFSESDLELTGDHFRHVDEEGRLVGVMFDDVVVHVDENAEGETERKNESYL